MPDEVSTMHELSYALRPLSNFSSSSVQQGFTFSSREKSSSSDSPGIIVSSYYLTPEGCLSNSMSSYSSKHMILFDLTEPNMVLAMVLPVLLMWPDALGYNEFLNGC